MSVLDDAMSPESQLHAALEAGDDELVRRLCELVIDAPLPASSVLSVRVASAETETEMAAAADEAEEEEADEEASPEAPAPVAKKAGRPPKFDNVKYEWSELAGAWVSPLNGETIHHSRFRRATEVFTRAQNDYLEFVGSARYAQYLAYKEHQEKKAMRRLEHEDQEERAGDGAGADTGDDTGDGAGAGAGAGAVEECVICLLPMEHDERAFLPCSHAFHQACIQRWLKRRGATCPVCRQTAF